MCLASHLHDGSPNENIKMKIDILSSDGIHASEKEAIKRMVEVFNSSSFSQKWHGYAGFMMMDTTYRDREIDLVLLTHDRLLIIELKKWRGKIEPMHDHWLRDGDDMGRSPVKVLADKWKIISSKIKARLKPPESEVYIDYRVVMCGSADFSEIPEDEKPFVRTLEQFLKVAKLGGYQSEFGSLKARKPCEYLKAFTPFFKGKDFKPSSFSFNNFQIVGEATFPHPEGLYKEYKSVKKDDQRHEALLRRWDFSALSGIADTIDERARIALREHKVLGFIHEQNEQLDSVVLQPLSHPTRDDIDADFCELYRLPSRQLRLNEFIHRFGEDLEFCERINFIKILLSHVADLHDLGVAHRDISDHTLWLERPSKISISGFLTAYFPEIGTVGSLRDQLRAGKTILPEDSEIGEGEDSNPFRRDVYLLAVVIHHILFLELPKQEDSLFVWGNPTDFDIDPLLSSWFETALNLIPVSRFSDARTMLNSFNALPLGVPESEGIDLRRFEPYRSELIPMVIYPIEENIKQGMSHIYKSTFSGESVSVKVWYGRKPDIKRPQETMQLQSFLDKARLVKSQPCSSLAEVIDFGISDAGTYLVQRWLNASLLKSAVETCSVGSELILLCQKIVKAVLHLHAMQLQHGDLHPDNILIEDGEVRFIDALDMPYSGDSIIFTPAYVPTDFESMTLEERDCYAVAKVCNEILKHTVNWEEVEPSVLQNEIESCMRRDFKVYSLERINDVLDAIINPPLVNEGVRLSVLMRQLTSSQELINDNGVFHISISEERVRSSTQKPHIIVAFVGVRKQLQIYLKASQLDFAYLRIKDIAHSLFVRIASRSVAQLDATIICEPSSVDDPSKLLEHLKSMPEVYSAILMIQNHILGGELSYDDEEIDNLESSEVVQKKPHTASLWRAILDAEEDSLPEIEITAPVIRDMDKRNEKLRIPYRKDGESLDYESDEKVEVLQEINGDLIRVGYVDIRETSQSILVLESPRIRIQTNIGDILKLRSQQDLSSFRRRRHAVTRILNSEAAIPSLINYFDPLICPRPQYLQSGPSDSDLDAYNRYDKDGKLTFSLNRQQRDAFTKLWSYGPLSLLQGPPGTGKTSFIASFIHYALSQGAQSILLASQSHEAVNNAAEKVIELCQHSNLALDVVRFGAEGMVSEQLRPHHSSSILQNYRDLFRSEMRVRISAMNRNLGLPTKFVERWFDIEYQLKRLNREIERLTAKLNKNERSENSNNQIINQRLERFKRVASDKFGYVGEGEPEEVINQLSRDAMNQFGVTSLDAVSRLEQVIAMSQEWVDRLGTLRGNFEEFLAKTRSLVCGTCVGLGRSQFGVAKNRYDWVIVDEAARATPGELAIAIQSGCRVLLVGDHRQLPPLYPEPVVRKMSIELNYSDRSVLTRSDFERAFESDYGIEVGATLRTQYRMAPPIGEMVSACFYPKPLEPGRGNPEPWFKELPKRLSSIVTWIDTSDAGVESYERVKYPGFDNPYEAREIMDTLRSICTAESFIQCLMDETSEEEKPIGVICMYAGQQRLLQRLLSEQDWATGYRHLIKIDTVDSYQGKENRIIIVATTRNNNQCTQGFLSSLERVNVAISRAMDRLIIIGAARMWREKHQTSALGRVLAYIEKHRDGNNFNLVQALGIEDGQK